MFLWQSTYFATVLHSLNMSYTVVDWISVSFYVEFQFLVQCVSDSCLSFVYVLWVVILGLDIYIFWGWMIGFTDFIAPYGCTGFKRVCCGVLVVVNYLFLLGINYFYIKINTISLRRTVLLCSSAVINLNYFRVYLWFGYLPVLFPSVSFSAHLFTPFRPFKFFFFPPIF